MTNPQTTPEQKANDDLLIQLTDFVRGHNTTPDEHKYVNSFFEEWLRARGMKND